MRISPERTRREAFVLIAAALVGGSRSFAADGLRFPSHGVELALNLDIEGAAAGSLGRVALGRSIATTLIGRFGPDRVELAMPLPGLLPDYRITGGIRGGRLELKIDRGRLGPRVVRAEVLRDGSCPSFEVFRADTAWRLGRRTLHGHALLAGPRPFIELWPEDGGRRYRSFHFGAACSPSWIEGRLRATRSRSEGPAEVSLARFSGELRQAG